MHNLPTHRLASAWFRWHENLGVILGTSFVAACLETVAFFAYLDPLMLGSNELPKAWSDNRPVAYSVALLFCWAVTLAASAINAYVVRPGDRSE